MTKDRREITREREEQQQDEACTEGNDGTEVREFCGQVDQLSKESEVTRDRLDVFKDFLEETTIQQGNPGDT